MEYSSSSASYDNSSSSSLSSSQFFVFSDLEENNNNNNNNNRSVRANAPSSFYSSLHGVRKLPFKPITKQPIAPFPPTKPKVYRVDPGKFKEVVQRLTAAPEFQYRPRRLQEIAPPALDLNNAGGLGRRPELVISPKKAPVSAAFPEVIERKSHKFSETCGALSPLGFSFSPSSMTWPFSPLLSPGTLALLDHGTVL